MHQIRVHNMLMTLEALRDNSTLKAIYLHENYIGDEGAKDLAKANEQISVCMFVHSLFVEYQLHCECELWIVYCG